MEKTRPFAYLLGVAAAAFLAVTMLAAPAYADVTTNDHTAAYAGGTYVSFGDSIAAGFAFDSEETVYGGKCVEGSYPYLVAQSLNMTEIPLAYSGFRTNEILRALGEGADGDVYTSLFTMAWPFTNSAAEYQAQTAEAVASAKLITIGIGSNDLMTSPVFTSAYNVLCANNPDEDENFYTVLSKIKTSAATLESYTDIAQLMDDMGLYTEFAEELTTQTVQSVASFYTNFDAIAAKIDASTDATVMVVGIFNPYRNATLQLDDDSTVIPIGESFSVAVDVANWYLQLEAEKYGFTYVDDTSIESFASALGAVPLTEAANADPHPTALGHEQIAQCIVDALPHQYVSSTVVEPTCESQGYTQHVCACGATYDDNYIAATGHTWVVSKTVAPTSMTAGYVEYVCSVCGATKTCELASSSSKGSLANVVASSKQKTDFVSVTRWKSASAISAYTQGASKRTSGRR